MGLEFWSKKFFFSISFFRFQWKKRRIFLKDELNVIITGLTVEPRYKKGSRDWPNLLAITRFPYIEVLSHIFSVVLLGYKNRWLYLWLPYLEDRYIEVPLFKSSYLSYSHFMIADCCTAFSQIRKRKKEKLLQEKVRFQAMELKSMITKTDKGLSATRR